MNTETTKPGKYGTLHLYRITYHDSIDPCFGSDASRVWAYNEEHAREKFLDSSYGQGFETFVIAKQARYMPHHATCPDAKKWRR